MDRINTPSEPADSSSADPSMRSPCPVLNRTLLESEPGARVIMEASAPPERTAIALTSPHLQASGHWC